MPLISQVPAKAPISNKIRIDDIAALILRTIPSSITSQLIDNLNPIKAAIAAERISVIWLEPANTSSPKMVTLVNKRITKKIMGMRASISEGFLAVFTIQK